MRRTLKDSFTFRTWFITYGPSMDVLGPFSFLLSQKENIIIFKNSLDIL